MFPLSQSSFRHHHRAVLRFWRREIALCRSQGPCAGHRDPVLIQGTLRQMRLRLPVSRPQRLLSQPARALRAESPPNASHATHSPRTSLHPDVGSTDHGRRRQRISLCFTALSPARLWPLMLPSSPLRERTGAAQCGQNVHTHACLYSYETAHALDIARGHARAPSRRMAFIDRVHPSNFRLAAARHARRSSRATHHHRDVMGKRHSCGAHPAGQLRRVSL